MGLVPFKPGDRGKAAAERWKKNIYMRKRWRREFRTPLRAMIQKFNNETNVISFNQIQGIEYAGNIYGRG